jgi:hypothetical protein
MDRDDIEQIGPATRGSDTAPRGATQRIEADRSSERRQMASCERSCSRTDRGQERALRWEPSAGTRGRGLGGRRERSDHNVVIANTTANAGIRSDFGTECLHRCWGDHRRDQSAECESAGDS